MSNVVNRGQQPNDQAADTLYVAFGKVNDKFTENDDLKQVQDATGKTTPVDADTLPLIDSAAGAEEPKLKWLSWAGLKATLKTYFDTVYSTFSGSYNDLSNKPTIPSAAGDINAEPANANIQGHIGTVGTPHVSTAEKTTWNAKGTSNLALGETSVTAYQGDRGKTAYDHSQAAHAPSNATSNDTDANLKNRANHTGTQFADTISNFAATVIASVLTGLSTTTNAVISAADTVLSALGKLQKQITDHVTTHPAPTNRDTRNEAANANIQSHVTSAHAPSNATANDTDANLKNRANHTGTQLAATISNFAATVLASVLTGLSTTTNAAITAADTVLTAIGKLQKQITDHLANHPSGISGLTTNKIPKASSATAVNDSNLEQVPAYNNLIRVGSQTVTESSPDANSLMVSGKLYVGNGGDVSGNGAQSANFAGAIRIGDAAGSWPGTIKYVSNDQDFYAYTGSEWKSLLAGASSYSGLEVITAITASTTLSASSHANKYIPVNSASATNITINGSVFAVNTVIAIEQTGAGIVTIVQGSGMTLNGSLKTWGQYSVIEIFFKSASVATIIGGVS